jgi:tetratricopeptide (TPR) repeat protein
MMDFSDSLNMGEYDKAVEDYSRAIKLKPDFEALS